MKIFTCFFTLVFSLALSSCREQNVSDANENRFQFSVLSSSSQSVTPEGTSLVINFISGDGKEVIPFENVSFQPGTTGFLTAPLDLPDNSYRVLDFILVNDAEEILYAMPREGSELATNSAATGIAPNGSPATVTLLDVARHEPHQFGYQSFTNPNHALMVKVMEKGTSHDMEATATVISGDDTLAQYTLKRGVNRIALPPRSTELQTVVVSRKSYASHTINLSTIDTKSRKPVDVILEPALNILSYIDLDGIDVYSFTLYLGAVQEGAPIHIDWGDGESETTALSSEWTTLYHEFPGSGNYRICITGALDQIRLFDSYYGMGMMDDVDFTHLTALEEIGFGLSRSPRVLDFTSNSKLKTLDLAGLRQLERIILPADHRITFIAFEGENKMTTASVDAVVANLYTNIVRNSTMSGLLIWAGNWIREEDDDTILGPPSATALAQAKVMKEQYKWSLSPDPFRTKIDASDGRVKTMQIRQTRKLKYRKLKEAGKPGM
jgi:hypothetical protein